MRRFQLHRREDVSGVSGTGVVAEGVRFQDGHVAMRWVTGRHHTTTVHASIASVKAIHGHGGRTLVKWLDPPSGGERGRE
jgi:hypothetical protein